MRAVITQLVTDLGMGSTPGQRLLFGGCSAGAIGAMNSLDAIAAMTARCPLLGAKTAGCTVAGLQVQGFLDGASLIDIRSSGWPWSNDLIPLQTLIAEVRARVPAMCAAAH